MGLKPISPPGARWLVRRWSALRKSLHPPARLGIASMGRRSVAKDKSCVGRRSAIHLSGTSVAPQRNLAPVQNQPPFVAGPRPPPAEDGVLQRATPAVLRDTRVPRITPSAVPPMRFTLTAAAQRW